MPAVLELRVSTLGHAVSLHQQKPRARTWRDVSSLTLYPCRKLLSFSFSFPPHHPVLPSYSCMSLNTTALRPTFAATATALLSL